MIGKLEMKMKDKLCLLNMLPLLRINSNYLVEKFRNTSLLDWMIDIWFLREAFFDAQENGLVPREEVFDPYSIWYDSGKNIKKPYDITYDLQIKIDQKHRNGKIYHSCPNTWIGVDSNNIYHGLVYIMVNKNEGIITTSAMSNKNFPVIESDLLESIIVYELYSRFIKNRYKLISVDSIENKFKVYEDKYELRLSTGYSTGDDYI